MESCFICTIFTVINEQVCSLMVQGALHKAFAGTAVTATGLVEASHEIGEHRNCFWLTDCEYKFVTRTNALMPEVNPSVCEMFEMTESIFESTALSFQWSNPLTRSYVLFSGPCMPMVTHCQALLRYRKHAESIMETRKTMAISLQSCCSLRLLWKWNSVCSLHVLDRAV
jgi:hypothetical protein